MSHYNFIERLDPVPVPGSWSAGVGVGIVSGDEAAGQPAVQRQCAEQHGGEDIRLPSPDYRHGVGIPADVHLAAVAVPDLRQQPASPGRIQI